MYPYFCLGGVTCAMAAYSLTLEPSMEEFAVFPFPEETSPNVPALFCVRWMHYMYFLYFSLFLVWYEGPNTLDAQVYLVLVLLVISSWKLFDCCLLTLYEWRTCGKNERAYYTHFHPCVFVFCGQYHDWALWVYMVLLTATFFYVLFYEESISGWGKGVAALYFVYIVHFDYYIQTHIWKQSSMYPPMPCIDWMGSHRFS